MKYYAVDFKDEWGFAIRADRAPTKVEIIKYEMQFHGYSVEDIKDIYEILPEEAAMDYGWSFIATWINGVLSSTTRADFTDKELILLWKELEDVPVYTAKDGSVCLDEPWFVFAKGTDCCEGIWRWFDSRYSKGVGELMNGKDA